MEVSELCLKLQSIPLKTKTISTLIKDLKKPKSIFGGGTGYRNHLLMNIKMLTERIYENKIYIISRKEMLITKTDTDKINNELDVFNQQITHDNTLLKNKINLLKKHTTKEFFENVMKAIHKGITNGNYADLLDIIDNNGESENDIEGDADDTDKNVFVISGHGAEKIIPFKDRMIVPPNTIVVLLTTCNSSTFDYNSCRIAKIMTNTDYKLIFSDPKANRSIIEAIFRTPIRIYSPLSKLPRMFNTLELSTILDNGNKSISKAGIYNIANIPPMDRSVIPELTPEEKAVILDECNEYSGMLSDSIYTKKIYDEAYKGSLMKPKYKKNIGDEIFEVNDIITKFGEGVYYITGCRNSIEGSLINDNLFYDIMAQSDDEQEKTFRSVGSS